MTTSTAKQSNIQNGLTFGLIIGLIYCVSLFLRYNMFTSNVVMMAVLGLVFYLIVIGLLFSCALKRRKELGGYIELKDAFQTIFVAILIAELIYTIFNYIYLKFIDPAYFDKLYAAMEQFFEKANMSDDAKEEQLETMREQFKTQKEKGVALGAMFLSYLLWVAITGVFGFIVALIVRKRRPVFESDANNFQQRGEQITN